MSEIVSRSLLVALPLALCVGGVNTGIFSFSFDSPAISECFAGEKKTHSLMDDGIRKELSLEKNLVNFNRASGMLTDILREQKRIFTESKAKGKNMTAMKVEDLINEANMHVSQGNYTDGYKMLETVHAILLDSIARLRDGGK